MNDIPYETLKQSLSFIADIGKRYDTELTVCEDTLLFGKSLVKTVQRDPTDQLRYYKEILVFSLARTVSRLESIFILLCFGRAAEASLILRALVEDTINVAYIDKEPIVRSLLYLRHGSKERALVMVREAEREPDGENKKELSAKAEYFEKEKALYEKDIHSLAPGSTIPSGNKWSGKNLWQMAKECGLSDTYNIIYTDLSSETHSQSERSHYFVLYDDSIDSFVPVTFPNDKDLAITVWAACWFALLICGTYNQRMDVGRENEVDLLQQRIESLKV